MKHLNWAAAALGYLAMILAGVAAVIYAFVSSLGDFCHYDVVNRISSPSGLQTAVIELGSCGGATTDFSGSVSVDGMNFRMSATKLLTFVGTPTEAGISVKWQSDSQLTIYLSNLYKIRMINPEGRNSADLQVKYIYVNQPIVSP